MDGSHLINDGFNPVLETASSRVLKCDSNPPSLHLYFSNPTYTSRVSDKSSDFKLLWPFTAQFVFPVKASVQPKSIYGPPKQQKNARQDEMTNRNMPMFSRSIEKIYTYIVF